MGRPTALTKTITASDANACWADVIETVRRGERRLLITSDGAPAAAIVSVADLQRLQSLDAQREEAFKALDATRAAFSNVPDEELEREVGRAVARARAKRRREARKTAPGP